jgi:hypothetical protein
VRFMKNKDKKNSNGGQESINKSRRKLSKTGLVGPVLLSLTSKPSWGFVCNFSNALSGNLSAQRTYGVTCNDNVPSTRTPQWYYSNPNLWPSSTLGITTTTLFNSLFTPKIIRLSKFPGNIGQNNTNPNFMDVLKNDSKVEILISSGPPKNWVTDSNQCAYNYAAALISASAQNPPTQIIFPYTSQQVLNAWSSQDPSFCTKLKSLQAQNYSVGQIDMLF